LVALYMLIVGVNKGLSHRAEKLLGLMLLAITVGKVIIYDLSMMSMQNKIIVLMLTGGAMMLFSYWVHSKKDSGVANSLQQ
jgi:hypothetical protein